MVIQPRKKDAIIYFFSKYFKWKFRLHSASTLYREDTLYTPRALVIRQLKKSLLYLSLEAQNTLKKVF